MSIARGVSNRTTGLPLRSASSQILGGTSASPLVQQLFNEYGAENLAAWSAAGCMKGASQSARPVIGNTASPARSRRGAWMALLPIKYVIKNKTPYREGVPQ